MVYVSVSEAIDYFIRIKIDNRKQREVSSDLYSVAQPKHLTI